VSRHVAGRRPRSAWLTAWEISHRARLIRRGPWGLILRVVAYYIVCLLAVLTLAMLISGGK
jgi:hypothetical protein